MYPLPIDSSLVDFEAGLSPLNSNDDADYIDPQILDFKSIFNNRSDSSSVATIEQLEIISNVLLQFHHFSILIRPAQRLEVARKLYNHIKVGLCARGDFFSHRGEVNQSGIVCILHGKVALYGIKQESAINHEMQAIGKVHILQHQIESHQKQNAGTRFSEEKQKQLDSLLKRKEFAEDELNRIRNKEETELLRVWNPAKYFKTENICAYAFEKYQERGTTLGEAQVINGFACQSTAVCVSPVVGFFSISSSAYREVFNLEISKTSFICNVLSRNFPGAKDDSIRRIAHDFVQEVYEYNKPIFEENDPANLLMIVRSGEVEAVRKTVHQSLVNHAGATPVAVDMTPTVSAGNFTSTVTVSTTTNTANAPDNQEATESTEQEQKIKQVQLRKVFSRKLVGGTNEMSIGIIGEGEIIGIEDVYSSQRVRTFKAVSKSNETIIYLVSKKQLDDVIILNDDSHFKRELRSKGRFKSEYYQNRTNKIIFHRLNSFYDKQAIQNKINAGSAADNISFKDVMAEYVKQAKLIGKETNQLGPSVVSNSAKEIPQIEQPLQLITTSPARTLTKKKLPTVIMTTTSQTEIVGDENTKTQDIPTSTLPQINSQIAALSPKKSSSRLLKSYNTIGTFNGNQISPISEEVSSSAAIYGNNYNEYDIIHQVLQMKKMQGFSSKFLREERPPGKLEYPPSSQLNSDGSVGTAATAATGGSIMSTTTSPLLGPFVSSTNAQEFEEAKQRLMNKKQFNYENKKNYRLKSENSRLNSIIKRAQQLNLDVPQSLSPKKKNAEKNTFFKDLTEVQALGTATENNIGSLPASPSKKQLPYQLTTRLSLQNIYPETKSMQQFFSDAYEISKKKQSQANQTSIISLADELLETESNNNNNNIQPKFFAERTKQISQYLPRVTFEGSSDPYSMRRLSNPMESLGKGLPISSLMSSTLSPLPSSKKPPSLNLISSFNDGDAEAVIQQQQQESNPSIEQKPVRNDMKKKSFSFVKTPNSRSMMKFNRAILQQANSILVTKQPVITDIVRRSALDPLEKGKQVINILQNSGYLDSAQLTNLKNKSNRNSQHQGESNSTRNTTHHNNIKPINIHKLQIPVQSSSNREGKSIDSERRLRMMVNESPLMIGKIIYSKK